MSGPLKAFVIGWPIEHSRSPLIHGHWLKTYGIDGVYQRIAVAPEGLEGFIAAMQAQGYVGGNVTIPHKVEVAKMCDRLTPRAEKLGVVNTLWFEDDHLCGDSTDGDGFVAALDEAVPGWSAKGSAALVLGAGGAAPAIVDAILARGFKVTIANRTARKAELLASARGCDWVPLDAANTLLPTIDLVVNTSAAGMKGESLPIDLGRLPKHAIVDDIVYSPLVTPLLAAAKAQGLKTVGGLGMLIHQAVPGFRHWFGIKPTVDRTLYDFLEADLRAAS